MEKIFYRVYPIHPASIFSPCSFTASTPSRLPSLGSHTALLLDYFIQITIELKCVPLINLHSAGISILLRIASFNSSLEFPLRWYAFGFKCKFFLPYFVKLILMFAALSLIRRERNSVVVVECICIELGAQMVASWHRVPAWSDWRWDSYFL